MPAAAPVQNRGERVCVVRRGDALWGVPARHTQGIAQIEHVTRVPRTSGHVLGVSHHRGAVLAVVDLAGPLALTVPALELPMTTLLVEATPLRVAVAVDEVVTFEMLEPALRPAGSPAVPPPFVAGRLRHARGTVALLDVEALLAALRIRRVA